jgi:ribosome-binding protein aMBF1 (putative translation factor)
MGTLSEITLAVAAEVRAEAARQGLSRADLAESAHLTTVSVRRYVYAVEREMPLSAAESLARALGLAAHELIRRAEEQLDADPIPPGRMGDYDLAADKDD